LPFAHFVKERNARFGARVRGFSQEAMEALCWFHWPGNNIRQISNAIQATMVIDSGDHIGLDTVNRFIDLFPEGKRVDARGAQRHGIFGSPGPFQDRLFAGVAG
jgi:DNA-binding NtrC family response regulator